MGNLDPNLRTKPRVILIRPHFKEVPPQFSYPIGLGYLAAVLMRNGFAAEIFDLNVLKIGHRDFVERLEVLDPDFIGVTALTSYYPAMRDLCRRIKKSRNSSSKPLIIGGVHVSSLPELSLRETGADYAVIGEGEITLIEMLKALIHHEDARQVSGLAFIKDDRFVFTGARPLVEDLDEIPPPAWDLIRPELYPKTPHGTVHKKGPAFPILTSRGCPFRCIYCASSNFWGNRIRYHSVVRAVNEIRDLRVRYGANEIQIWDDNFTLKRSRVVEFCRELTERRIRLRFSCPNGVKVDTLDRELLGLLKAAGFYDLTLAIESGSPRIQSVIRKELELGKAAPIVAEAKRLGFFTRAFFIIGFPTETTEDIRATLKLALRLKLDHANFFVFVPLPGSDFFGRWVQGRDARRIDWSCDFFSRPQDMSGFNRIETRDLLKLQRHLYVRFYVLRPIKMAGYIRHLKPLQYLGLFRRAFSALIRR